MKLWEAVSRLGAGPREMSRIDPIAGVITIPLPDLAVDRVKDLDGCTLLHSGTDKVDVLAGRAVFGVKLDEGGATIIGKVHFDERDGSQWLHSVELNFHPEPQGQPTRSVG